MANDRFKLWLAVPNDSKLVIKVTGSDANFNVTGVRLGDPTPIPHATLAAPDGYTLELVSPRVESVTLSIVFLGAQPTTVTFDAQVVKSNGKPYGKRDPYVTTGTNGQADTALCIAITKK
jgi:hypothetical protein